MISINKETFFLTSLSLIDLVLETLYIFYDLLSYTENKRH